jgi:phosphoglycerate dehydrogenase-like enzyme
MKVAFAGFFAVRFTEAVQARLSIPSAVVAGDESEILGHLRDADVLVSMGFTAAMAEAAPKLRLVQVPGAGLDRIERTALRPGMHLANAYGHDAGIAEYIMGAMIALSRSFSRLDARMREGVWDSQWAIGTPAPPLWPELAGKTLGILGFGHIGEALARRARAFDMRVCAIRTRAQQDLPEGVDFIGGPERLEEVLSTADYLAITLSLSPQTRGLLDAAKLAVMKPGAFLINVARAEIVDESALYEALRTGKLGGAALDVWYRYPQAPGPAAPSTREFHALSNVIMTPHVSGWTEGMIEARTRLIVDNIERVARGEAPLNAIAP